jgi:hypothetical protein
MSYDNHSLLGFSTVQGGGVVSSTTGTSIQLSSSSGFASGANQNITVWPSGVDPTTSNAEIMRITNNNTQNNTLTVTRAQEGSTALGNIAVGYQVANTITPKVLTDIEQDLYQPYKFSYYRAAAANTGNGVFALVTFDTKLFDTSSNYSTSTGKFTAPVAGFYQFNWQVRCSPTLSGYQCLAALYQNGVAVYDGSEIRAVTASQAVASSGSALIQCALNDYIQIYVYSDATAPLVVDATGDNMFNGFLVSQT